MTSQPGQTPQSAPTASQLTRPLRELAALVLVGANALLLLVALLDLLIPADNGPRFTSRAASGFFDFMGITAIVLPLLAVLLATHITPVVGRARLITQAAVGEYAFSAFFGVVSFFGWLIGSLANGMIRGVFTGFLTRIAFLAIFAVAALAVFRVWRTLYYTPRAKREPGLYGRPQPGGPAAPGGPGGFGQPGGPAGFGQPGGPGGFGQPGDPSGFGQPGGPGQPDGFGQPGGSGQLGEFGQPGGPAGRPVPGQPAPTSAPPAFGAGDPASQPGTGSAERTQVIPRPAAEPEADRTEVLPGPAEPARSMSSSPAGEPGHGSAVPSGSPAPSGAGPSGVERSGAEAPRPDRTGAESPRSERSGAEASPAERSGAAGAAERDADRTMVIPPAANPGEPGNNDATQMIIPSDRGAQRPDRDAGPQ
ncbi:hypothetical protein ACFFWC_30110 [Plantactinospora siamensis]|uniref:Uncharacterized protein n=1 Tax=Plantactinospora siamensis TaxID=555372 RepID=A0ABV6NVL2_9ACTN